MAEWVGVAAGWCVAFVLVIWFLGFVGAGNPSPSDIEGKCGGVGVAQVVQRPWPEQLVRVVCRDGSVGDAP